MQQHKVVFRLPAVQQHTNLSRSTIYRLEAAGKFPARIRLGEHSIGWLASEVEAWIESRPRAKSAQQ